MKHLRRISFFLALFLALSLMTACGGGDEGAMDDGGREEESDDASSPGASYLHLSATEVYDRVFDAENVVITVTRTDKDGTAVDTLSKDGALVHADDDDEMYYDYAKNLMYRVDEDGSLHAETALFDFKSLAEGYLGRGDCFFLFFQSKYDLMGNMTAESIRNAQLDYNLTGALAATMKANGARYDFTVDYEGDADSTAFDLAVTVSFGTASVVVPGIPSVTETTAQTPQPPPKETNSPETNPPVTNPPVTNPPETNVPNIQPYMQPSLLFGMLKRLDPHTGEATVSFKSGTQSATFLYSGALCAVERKENGHVLSVIDDPMRGVRYTRYGENWLQEALSSDDPWAERMAELDAALCGALSETDYTDNGSGIYTMSPAAASANGVAYAIFTYGGANETYTLTVLPAGEDEERTVRICLAADPITVPKQGVISSMPLSTLTCAPSELLGRIRSGEDR